MPRVSWAEPGRARLRSHVRHTEWMGAGAGGRVCGAWSGLLCTTSATALALGGSTSCLEQGGRRHSLPGVASAVRRPFVSSGLSCERAAGPSGALISAGRWHQWLGRCRRPGHTVPGEPALPAPSPVRNAEEGPLAGNTKGRSACELRVSKAVKAGCKESLPPRPAWAPSGGLRSVGAGAASSQAGLAKSPACRPDAPPHAPAGTAAQAAHCGAQEGPLPRRLGHRENPRDTRPRLPPRGRASPSPRPPRSLPCLCSVSSPCVSLSGAVSVPLSVSESCHSGGRPGSCLSVPSHAADVSGRPVHRVGARRRGEGTSLAAGAPEHRAAGLLVQRPAVWLTWEALHLHSPKPGSCRPSAGPGVSARRWAGGEVPPTPSRRLGGPRSRGPPGVDVGTQSLWGCVHRGLDGAAILGPDGGPHFTLPPQPEAVGGLDVGLSGAASHRQAHRPAGQPPSLEAREDTCRDGRGRWSPREGGAVPAESAPSPSHQARPDTPAHPDRSRASPAVRALERQRLRSSAQEDGSKRPR